MQTIYITEAAERKSKAGRDMVVLNIMNEQFNKKTIFTDKDRLAKVGFTDEMVTSKMSELVEVNAEIDWFKDFPEILRLELAS